MRGTKRSRSHKTVQVIVMIAVALAMSGIALRAEAEPKGPNGEQCDSSETGVAHQINGKNYTCDKCVYLKCSTGGGQISNCQKVTYWSNCVEALVRSNIPFAPTGVLQNAPANTPPQNSMPKAPATGGTKK